VTGPVNKLVEIATATEARVALERKSIPLEALLEQLSSSRVPHPVLPAFRQDGMHVIAEIKRSSPSRGMIASSVVPLDVARAYLDAGATAISVLTEPQYFGGDIAFLTEIRGAFPKSLLLMKDFILDEYQLVQARVCGADMVLLIVNLLGEQKLHQFYEKASELGLTPLVEVHDEKELSIAARIGAQFIGVNNRSLVSLEVSLDTSIRLAASLPQNSVVVSESGLHNGEQLKMLSRLGYRGFLVGTSLMETNSPGPALRALLQAAS